MGINLVVDKKLVWIIFYIVFFFFSFILSCVFWFPEGKNIPTENSKVLLILQKMEPQAVLDFYGWSVVNYGIRYILFIDNGDSNSYSAVDKGQRYRTSVFFFLFK